MLSERYPSVKRPPTSKPCDLTRRCRAFEARNEALRRALLLGTLVSGGDTQH
jgi:hypothetical protein